VPAHTPPKETAGTTASVLPDRCAKLTAIIARHVNPLQPMRILEVGCRCGDQIFSLARAFPAAELTGVDISRNNIATALKRRESEEGGERITFIGTDFLAFRGQPFDLVLADSSLEKLEVRRDALFPKLSRDLAAGGLLVISLPDSGAFNRTLWAARRLLRARRRYRPPAHVHSEELRRFLSEVCGLRHAASYPVGPRNFFAPRERTSVWTKPEQDPFSS
jgi:trans-aconitate methyltransferase